MTDGYDLSGYPSPYLPKILRASFYVSMNTLGYLVTGAQRVKSTLSSSYPYRTVVNRVFTIHPVLP